MKPLIFNDYKSITNLKTRIIFFYPLTKIMNPMDDTVQIMESTRNLGRDNQDI